MTADATEATELYRLYRRTDVALFDLPEGTANREVKALATIVSEAAAVSRMARQGTVLASAALSAVEIDLTKE